MTRAKDISKILTDADISGNIDVDGVTNLDVVDIDGAVDMASTLNVSGVLTANAGIKVDNITIDGTEIDLSSSSFTIDSAANITLDCGTGEFLFNNGGNGNLLKIQADSSNVNFIGMVQDKDLVFKGNDGGSGITALTLDMSDAGTAVFNNRIRGADASDGSPTYSFTNDTHSGMFSAGNDLIGFSTGGTERVRIHTGGNVTLRTQGTKVAAANSVSAYCVVDLSQNFKLRGNASFNVGSVTRHGTGDFTVNFSSGMADANYAVVGSSIGAVNTDGVVITGLGGSDHYRATGSQRMNCRYAPNNSVLDADGLSVIFVGRDDDHD